MRRLSAAAGQGLVEFAVVFPLFALMLFVLVDGGLVMGHYNTVTNAAREGARTGAVGAPSSEIISVVKAQVHGALDDADTNCADYDTAADAICVEWIEGSDTPAEAPGTFGSTVRVRIKYDYKLVTPMFGLFGGGPNPTWPISACGTARLETLLTDADQQADPGYAAVSGVSTCGS